MSKFITCAAATALLLSASAAAHPFAERYKSRGACEKRMAEINNYDREFVAGPIFGIDHNGEAAVFFLEAFQCELDSASGLWRIADHRGDDSANGRAWDD